MAEEVARRLGRGLAALIGDVGEDAAAGRSGARGPAQGADRVPAAQSAQSAHLLSTRRIWPI